jgi:hypothetical protein
VEKYWQGKLKDLEEGRRTGKKTEGPGEKLKDWEED